MFEGLFQPMHLIIILAIVLLLFGPTKLAGLGKGMGDAIRGFKNSLKEIEPSEKPNNKSEEASQDAKPQT